MQTTATYASSWAATSLTGPNGAQGTTSYDSYGRPSQTTTPDGATTYYSYTYSPGASTQTATLDGRWQTTTLDGFGRTIQVQKGNGSTVVSTVWTDYAPCACSPLGKLADVSEPYAPGATTVWTSYYYDGSGRTLSVTAPDGNSTTNYTYQGNSTTVTDPAGKWKTSTVDAYGNVVVMTEPNPAGGTFTSNYKYTPANQLTQVSMVRGNVTQTRTFAYSGSDLMSATNPENGTVNYTYDSAHHVLSRTGAMGSSTQYTYDSYGRLTEVQYYPSWFSGTEDTLERVNYYYDNSLPSTYQSSPFTGSLNGTGRLTGVSFEGGVKDDTYDGHYWAYAYQYNTAGRVINQNVTLMATHGSSYNNLQPVTPPIATFTAGYQWDDEGRMTGMQSPTVTPNSYSSWPYPTVMPTMGYQYDVNGRMTGMTSNGSSYATASYSAAGQLLTLAYGGLTETRTYNSMMQLVTQSAPGYLNMTYNYSATQNNGRITSAVDGITGENTTYTYDALNRLTNAANSLWSEAYGYDGFGNLTSKSGSGGSPNSAPSMSVAFNANNQQTSMSYDGDGNLESVGGYPAGYSVENKLSSLTSNYYPYNGGTYYAYDPHGKRMMRYTNPDPDNVAGEYNPAWEFYFYTITGQRLATMDCTNPNGNPLPSCSVVGENVYFGKKLLVSNGATVVTDRLGSVRANTQGESFAYYPYGEERTNTVNGRDKFATYLRDAVGQDYAEQRYYNGSMGRFMTVDPGGIRTARVSRPSSWNRYAYVEGDPVNFIDPAGTNLVAVGTACVGYEVTVCSTAYVLTGPLTMENPGDDAPEGGGGDASTIYTEAIFSAIAALSDPACAALFNTNPSAKNQYAPADVLATMAFGASPIGGTVPQGSYFGSIDFSRLSLDFEAVTVADPATSISTGANSVQAASATIYLQSNPLSSGFYGDQTVQELALTLIHELGHVYNNVYGLGGSQIVYDASADATANQAAETQNEKTLQACHPKN